MAPTTNRKEDGHGVRLLRHALAPTGARPEGGARLRPADPALARRARLHRSLDRRAPHRALGAAPGARPPDRPGADADQAAPHRPRRLPAALPPPGGVGEPGGHARPP